MIILLIAYWHLNWYNFSFQTFTIAGPQALATADNDGVPTATKAAQSATVGHCATDMFSATGAPVICGENKGQHSKLLWEFKQKFGVCWGLIRFVFSGSRHRWICVCKSSIYLWEWDYLKTLWYPCHSIWQPKYNGWTNRMSSILHYKHRNNH